VLIQDNFLNLAPTQLERCRIIKYYIWHQMAPLLTKVLTCNFFLVFVCIIHGQQSNLVCSHTDTHMCSPYMVIIISSVSGIVNVMHIVILAAVCLFNLCSLGAIIITQ